MFAEKRRRKDRKDEFKTADATNKVFSDRIRDLAKGRKRPLRMAALAKLKLRPRARRRFSISFIDILCLIYFSGCDNRTSLEHVLSV